MNIASTTPMGSQNIYWSSNPNFIGFYKHCPLYQQPSYNYHFKKSIYVI